jgi:PAS domain S-box-containing protein
MPARPEPNEAFRQAALAVSTAEGEYALDQLVTALARILGVEFALISVYVEPRRAMLRTLATFFDGRLTKNIEYPLAGTPCEQAIGRSFGFYQRGVAQHFPDDEVLSRNGIEAYAATTLHDVDGAPIGALTVMSRREIRDAPLTEAMLNIFGARVSAEIGRRRSEASYRAVFENAETAIVLHDVDSGAIVDANPRAIAVYGYGLDELKRLSLEEISSGVPPYTGEHARHALERARGGEVVRGEWHRRNKDGSLHWDEITLKKVEIAGRPHIMAATREITERKAAEEALRASEEQYRAIFNATTDSLTLRDADFRIVDVNATYERMSGLKREDVVGMTELTVDVLDVKDWRRDVHARVLRGEAVRIESDARRRDGTLFRVEVLVLPIQYRGAPHALLVARDITERKRADEALRASEEQYRAIFNAMADGLTLRDAEFRVVEANPAYAKMTGFPLPEVIGSDHVATLSLRDRDFARALHARARAGEPVQLEGQARRKDGALIDCEVYGVPMSYRGAPHVLYIGRDITARKAAESALRGSEEQYRAIFNATADALVLRDGRFRIVDVNAAYEAMSGKRRDEVIGMTDLTLTRNATTVDRRRLHEEALAGKPVHFEADGRREDGSPFVLEVRGVPMTYLGEPHVLYIGHGATEAKLAERALRDSWEQYRAIFDATTDSHVLRDAEFRIVDVNPAYEAMSGSSRAEALGRRDVTMSDPVLSARIRDLHARALAGEQVAWEAQARRRDGTPFAIEVRGVPIQHQGQPHVLYIGRDISDTKRAEAERAQLEAQLRQAQKMEAIGQLTGGIAHDFNNILQGILGNLVLAEERQAELGDAKLARYLERAHGASQRARDLIQQMLTFSRGQSGERRPAAPAALLKDATRLLRPTLPASIELHGEIGADLPAVLVDTVQFEQVLLNLCINARDAMRGEGRIALGARATDAGGAVCASCRQRVDGRFLEISVRDSGPGIAPEVRERMFDPFYSTKEVGKGSGMGLAMVHGIVHQHGGHVLVESAPGAGAEFRVLVPAALEDADTAAAGAGPARRAARARLAGRVLVAEDEAPIRELLEDLLGGWGLEVALHANGATARDAFASEPHAYDLVLTDNSMPRLSGLQLARVVSRIRPGVPVILCTGYGEELQPPELEAAGVRTLVKKPVEPAELREVLRAALPTRNKAPT